MTEALRVVGGSPTAEELAVVTALVAAAARAGDAAGPAPHPLGGWSDPARRLRTPLRPGPNAWRASAW
jgi:hypothetical protein